MSSIEKQLEELDKEDLGKKLCLRCLAAGLSIKNSLWDEKKMEKSSYTSDLICPHCSVVEDEQGHKRIPRGEINYAGRIMRAFEDYKNTK
jgi:hypothetical protein